MKILHLHLKFEYFDAIRSGEKTEEYREAEKWLPKMAQFDQVKLYRGYQKASSETVMNFEWRGFRLKTIVHPHFDNVPTQVCAIDVSKRIEL